MRPAQTNEWVLTTDGSSDGFLCKTRTFRGPNVEIYILG